MSDNVVIVVTEAMAMVMMMTMNNMTMMITDIITPSHFKHAIYASPMHSAATSHHFARLTVISLLQIRKNLWGERCEV
jgi:hypothetical protein